MEVFVFEDCMPYIALFMAIRSENWNLHLKLISQPLTIQPTHYPMHSGCIKHARRTDQMGGFTLSITGCEFHSVGLDESHQMLINKDVKWAVI